MKKTYWDCDHCSQKAFDEFPKTWIHIRQIEGVLGKYDTSTDRYGEKKYPIHARHKTFCCIECFFKWLYKHFPDKMKGVFNPSEKEDILGKLALNGEE